MDKQRGDQTESGSHEPTDASTTLLDRLRDSSLALFVPGFVRRRLIAKLLLVLWLVIMVSTLIGAVSYVRISDTLSEDAKKQIEATTALHENAYNNWFGSRREEITAVAKEDVLLTGTQAEISRRLDILRSKSDPIQNYYYINKSSGKIIGSSEERAVGTNITEVGISLARLQKQSFVTTERYRSFSGFTAFGLGRNVPYVNRVLIAEVRAVDGGPEIQQTISGATTTVVNREGTVVLRNGSAVTIPATLGEGTTVRETETQIIGYQPIATENQLVVVTKTPKEEALGVKTTVLRSFVTTVLLTVAFITLVIVIGGRGVVRDLNRLVDRAQRMAAGDLDVDFTTTREDEIGVLYAEFEEMNEALKQRIQEIETARDRLENQRMIVSVLNRVLRHNVRNKLNIVRAHAEMLASDDQEGDPEAIIENVQKLTEEAEQARLIEKYASTDAPTEIVDLGEYVREATAQVETAELTLTVSAQEDCYVRGNDSLVTAIGSLIEYLDHCETGSLSHITITVECTPAPTVSIETNGSGVPRTERQAFRAKREQPLQHADSVGLWLADGIITSLDGTLAITEDGTVLTLSFDSPSDFPDE